MNALRPIAAEDSPILLRWRNRPEVARFMYTDHMISPEEHADWFARALTRSDARYWIIASESEEVGLVGVTEIDRRHGTCSWAFYIAESSARGHGIGAFTEYTTLNLAFDELGMRKLSCEVLASNPTVVNMHERFGFVREGLFRAQILKDGEALDVHRLGLLREEWAQVRETHRAALLEKGIITS
jgi:UDP-4-amino-4,6-dideoxy-N-acetyl-beta-L-altrosamine N-acetyltransferase